MSVLQIGITLINRIQIISIVPETKNRSIKKFPLKTPSLFTSQDDNLPSIQKIEERFQHKIILSFRKQKIVMEILDKKL